MSFGDRPLTRIWEQWEVEKLQLKIDRLEELLASSREVVEQRRLEIIKLEQYIVELKAGYAT